MKFKLNRGKKILMVLLAVTLCTNLSYGQLSGKYTIDQNVKTGGTNFSSFGEFSAALTKEGVKGPVIADVVSKSGPYNEAVSFYEVQGADAKNTITINGNGETIQSGGKIFYVIELHGASFFTFDNLNVEMNTSKGSSYEKCYWIHEYVSKSGTILSSNITIKNSNLTMPGIASANQFSAYIGITSSENGFNKLQQAAGENIVIENNKMTSTTDMGPFQGVLVLSANNSKGYHRVSLIDNEIRDFYCAGVYSFYNAEMIVIGNEIHNSKSTGHQAGNIKEKMGIYLNISQSDIGKSEIRRNNIHDVENANSGAYFYGIYVSGGSATGGNCIVNDNTVVQKTGYGNTNGILYQFYKSSAFSNVEVNGNKIDLSCLDEKSDYVVTGIHLHGEGNATVSSVNCTKNQIYIDAPAIAYGINVEANEMKSLKSENYISNNVVNVKSDLLTSGIRLILKGTDGEFQILNNSINLGGCSFVNFAGMKVSYGLELYVANGRRENNLINVLGKKGGDVFAVYDESSKATYANNCLYLEPSKLTNNYYGYYNSLLGSFTDWVKGSGAKNEINEPAMYVDEANKIMIPGNPKLVNAGMPVKEITEDVFGTMRNEKTPDIGAIEFFYDIEVVSLKLKGGDVCEGSEEKINVTLKNNNPMELPFLSVDVYSNGILIGKGASKGPVGAGKSSDIEILVKYKGFGLQTIIAKVADDENMKNNEAKGNVTIMPSPAGSEFSANSNSKAQHLSKSSYDMTTVEDGLIYDVNSPKIFTNSDYGSGSGWLATISTTYADGTPVPSKDAAIWNKKKDKVDGTISFFPSDNLVDSTLTISLNIVDENSGCDTTITRDVLVVSSGKPGFIVPTILCEDLEVAFDNTSSIYSGSMTYAWDFDDNKATSTSTHPFYKFSGPGVYNVKLTTTTIPWGIVREYTTPVVIGVKPVADFKKLNACEGEDIVLTNTSQNASSYHWSFGDKSNPDVTTEHAQVNYAPGSYTVSLVVVEKGCIDSISKMVIQYAMPKADFSLTSGLCTSDEFVFENKSTISNGKIGYSWDFDDNGSFSTSKNPTYFFQNAAEHNVVLKAASEFGCENTIAKKVEVMAGPTANFSYDAACSETVTYFTNLSTTPSGTTPSYAWNFGDGSTVDTDVNPGHNWTSKGTYQSELTVLLDNGCKDSYKEIIKVLDQPTVSFSVNDACVGEEVIFNNNSTWDEGEISYTWDFDGAVTAANDIVSPKAVVNNAGQFHVILEAKLEGGCENSASQTLIVSETPNTCKIVATPDHENGVNGYKFESSADGVNASTEADVSYFWVIAEHGTKTGASIQVDFQEEGDFTVQLTARNNKTGCECISEVNHNNVGIEEELNLDNNVLIYPNPANSQVTILLDQSITKGAKIEIINSLGAVVKTISLVDGKVVFDINDLTSGLYLVRITSGNTISTKKLTITK